MDQGSTYEQTAHQRSQSMMTILELCLVHTTLNTARKEDAPFNSTMDTIPNKTPVRLSITIIGQHYCILMSTHETALSMDTLRPLDKEILIGQVSYKQRAKIYNDIHGYSGQREDKRVIPGQVITRNGRTP